MPTQHVICIIHGGHIVLVSLILYHCDCADHERLCDAIRLALFFKDCSESALFDQE